MLQSLAAFSLLSLTSSSFILGSNAQTQLNPGSYAAKVNQQCPQRLIRSTPVQNQTLNEQEAAYITARKLLQPQAWKDWIGTGRNIGYDLDTLQITSNNGNGLPNIGIAASGGGYRCVWCLFIFPGFLFPLLYLSPFKFRSELNFQSRAKWGWCDFWPGYS